MTDPESKIVVEIRPSPRRSENPSGREQPLGIVEVAELLGVARGTVDQWRRRGIMVEPDFVLSGSPAWWRASVESWAKSTNRMNRSKDAGT